MLDQVLDVFDVAPDVDLSLMQHDQTLAALTSRAIQRIDAYIADVKPDVVLVQGDTTTVFCASLAAFYRGVRVGHVEAGLRTWKKTSPFPEEINRVLTSRLADYHFAPTQWARDNLLREGVAESSVFVTGNTVIDALEIAMKKIREAPPDVPALPPSLLSEASKSPIVLITGHRRESFGRGFEAICDAIAKLSTTFPETEFVYPVHMNPNVREPTSRILGGIKNVRLIEPVPYLAFVLLMMRARIILTDSGGVQEEAPSLGKPVLVMREFTERPEGVENGCATLVGTSVESIVAGVEGFLSAPESCVMTPQPINPYGDGKACQRIVEILQELARREAQE